MILYDSEVFQFSNINPDQVLLTPPIFLWALHALKIQLK